MINYENDIFNCYYDLCGYESSECCRKNVFNCVKFM